MRSRTTLALMRQRGAPFTIAPIKEKEWRTTLQPQDMAQIMGLALVEGGFRAGAKISRDEKPGSAGVI